MTREECIFTVLDNVAHAAFDRVVVDLDAAVCEKKIKTCPVFCNVL